MRMRNVTHDLRMAAPAASAVVQREIFLCMYQRDDLSKYISEMNESCHIVRQSFHILKESCNIHQG